MIAETRTATRHGELARRGMHPRLRAEADRQRYPYVLLAVPPSQVGDQAEEVARAARLWSRRGRFGLISSTAVYAEQQGGICEEDSPLSDLERGAEPAAGRESQPGRGRNCDPHGRAVCAAQGTACGLPVHPAVPGQR